MKINGPGDLSAIRAYTAQAKKKNTEPNSNIAPAQEDRLDISPEAIKMQSYKTELQQLPEIREHLVIPLKEQIDAGTYEPDSYKTADGIIREHKMDQAG